MILNQNLLSAQTEIEFVQNIPPDCLDQGSKLVFKFAKNQMVIVVTGGGGLDVEGGGFGVLWTWWPKLIVVVVDVICGAVAGSGTKMLMALMVMIDATHFTILFPKLFHRNLQISTD